MDDSDCACCESSERKVVLLGKLIKSSPADLKKFRSLCKTEVRVLHQFLSSGFSDRSLFELEKILSISCFSAMLAQRFEQYLVVLFCDTNSAPQCWQIRL